MYSVFERLTKALVRGGHAFYRYHYGVGIHTHRLLRRTGRGIARTTAPFRRWVAGVFYRAVGRRVVRFAGRLGRMFAAIPYAFRDMGAAAKKGVGPLFSCFGRLLARGYRHYHGELGVLWRLIGPAAAIVVLGVTVGMWTGTDFCLSLTYRGEELGYIDHELTYDAAASLARERVTDEDHTFRVDEVASLAITVRGQKTILDDTQLCNAILRTAGDAITEASGLYIDNKFIGAMASRYQLDTLLEDIKGAYYDKSNKDQRAEFVQKVEVEDGLYTTTTVVDKETMANKLTAEAVVKKTYVVQSGDTLSTIAEKNDMTTGELRAMNPAFKNTDMVHIGDELMVQRPQPFLRVKVIKTIRYTEKIDYKTVTEYDDNKPVTYTHVKKNGVEGSQKVVAEVTYMDGVESGRKVISVDVTKQPVTKIVVKGTKRVLSSDGSAVQQGDGISHGSMMWPVPICRNMSRGFGYGHYALDICNGPVTVRGKPAVAADGGKVIFSGNGGGYGNVVKIQHANGLVTLYAHLQSRKVVTGQQVSRGQTVGLIGNTGWSYGPHLHFEVIKNGVKVNPLNYVSPR